MGVFTDGMVGRVAAESIGKGETLMSAGKDNTLSIQGINMSYKGEGCK